MKQLIGKVLKAIASLVLLLVIASMVFTWIITPIYPNRYGYAVLYNISSDKVTIQDRPHNCDWGWAPIGEKGCHYQKIVTGWNAAGTPVAGNGAPKYNRDTKTGKPILSYDGGKTWDWLNQDFPGLTVTKVEIMWVKVDDKQ